MVVKNFNEKASTIKPKTILTEFIHPPERGSEFNHDGNIANSVNGIENAKEKPNIPIIGFAPSPDAASTSNAPTIGPTHDKLTITVVSAIKNDPINPPLSALLSVLFARLPGRTISNNPKNDAANAMNRTKNIVLVIQCDVSVVAKSEPRLNSETINPNDV
jgi:hypothetical protein